MTLLNALGVRAMENRRQIAIAGAVFSSVLFYRLSRRVFEWWKRERRYDAAIARALEERELSIEWAEEIASSILPEERDEVLAMDYEELKAAVRDGRVSCVTVLCAYTGAALAAHRKTNCAVGFIRRAIDDARELDNQRQAGIPCPPLFGIPISVKESLPMIGYASTMGLVARLGIEEEVDAQLVDMARRNGAIPFVRTNVPTSLMTTTTINAIYGATTHPLDATRAAGGSSGGEGALIAMGGSLLGLGSDIGGSIRVPAAYSGCAGFKPSSLRQSNNHYSQLPGRPFLMPSDGPLSQSMQACVDLLRAAWTPQESQLINSRDPYTAPVPFDEEKFREGRKLRIGFWFDHPSVHPLPAMQRAVKEAKVHLEQAGHTLIPFTLPGIDRVTPLCVALVGLDNFASFSQLLENDRTPSEFRLMRLMSGMSTWTKWVVGKLALLAGEREVANSMLSFPSTPTEVNDRINELFAWRRSVIDAMQEENLDCLLSYPGLSPALKLSSPLDLPHELIAPTFLYNLLDFGAGVIQVSSWNEDDDRSRDTFRSRNVIERVILKDTENATGLPLAVQMAAPPYHDELALRALCDLEKKIKKREGQKK